MHTNSFKAQLNEAGYYLTSESWREKGMTELKRIHRFDNDRVVLTILRSFRHRDSRRYCSVEMAVYRGESTEFRHQLYTLCGTSANEKMARERLKYYADKVYPDILQELRIR